MKITVLVDNNSRIDNYLLAEPALSFFIEYENKKILFDAGYSDIFFQNAKKLEISLADLTDIVISHGHNDHTGGLRYLPPDLYKVNLIAHPNIFDTKFDANNIAYGCPISKAELENIYTLNLTKNPFYITENLLFLGQIENNISDDIDDSALVYIMKDKLFIITGCSHSGIINIINYAKKITRINKIYGVLGGLHLIGMKKTEIENIAQAFQKENIEYLAPCHCCDLKSKIILSKYIDIQEMCVGDVINLQ